MNRFTVNMTIYFWLCPRVLSWPGLVLFVLLLLFDPLHADAVPTTSAQGPIRVLIIDGCSNHDWKRTTQLVRAIIQPTGLFNVTGLDRSVQDGGSRLCPMVPRLQQIRRGHPEL
jgi:hypothetical protein